MFRTSRYSYNLGSTTTTPTAPTPIQGVKADTVIIDEMASGGTAPEVTGVISAPGKHHNVPVGKTRHERRRDKVFNRRLKKRLEKDGIPATIEVLPDGGIHVNVDGKK